MGRLTRWLTRAETPLCLDCGRRPPWCDCDDDLPGPLLISTIVFALLAGLGGSVAIVIWSLS
jgi:hypothetical protein